MTKQTKKDSILCIGEVLWDVFPTGKFIGGAPLNVACHLSSLGLNARIASRVGKDLLGEEMLLSIMSSGLFSDLIQVDNKLPTGRVEITLTDAQTPHYRIAEPVAWDEIQAEGSLVRAAAEARAIVFGSLAQRNSVSRDTIQSLLQGPAMRVFDVNLRPPFVNRTTIEKSFQSADMLKLNHEELDVIRSWFALSAGDQPAVEEISRRFDCPTICVTRGARGAMLWHDNQWQDHGGFVIDPVDPVGAGDSFLAALLDGLLNGRDGGEALDYANAVGAFVATQPCATPVLDFQAIDQLRGKQRPIASAEPAPG